MAREFDKWIDSTIYTETEVIDYLVSDGRFRVEKPVPKVPGELRSTYKRITEELYNPKIAADKLGGGANRELFSETIEYIIMFFEESFSLQGQNYLWMIIGAIVGAIIAATFSGGIGTPAGAAAGARIGMAVRTTILGIDALYLKSELRKLLINRLVTGGLILFSYFSLQGKGARLKQRTQAIKKEIKLESSNTDDINK